jgi:hypothetical protein
MAKATGPSIRERGFDPRWGHRADTLACAPSQRRAPRRPSPPTFPSRRALTAPALSLSWRPRHRATNAVNEVRLLAGRPEILGSLDLSPTHALVPAAPDAGLRSLSTRVRLPARAPQGGTAPGEAHNLAPVGSTPTPASAMNQAIGGSHKAGREGSTPSVATFWVWLNLVRAPVSGTGD